MLPRLFEVSVVLLVATEILGASIPPAHGDYALAAPAADADADAAPGGSLFARFVGLASRSTTKSTGSRASKMWNSGSKSSGSKKPASGNNAPVRAVTKAAATKTKVKTKKQKTKGGSCTPRPSGSSTSSGASATGANATGSSTNSTPPAGPTAAPGAANQTIAEDEEEEEEEENYCDSNDGSGAVPRMPSLAGLGLIAALPIAVGVHEFW